MVETLAKRGKNEPNGNTIFFIIAPCGYSALELKSKHLSLTPGTSWFILSPSWPAYSSAISSGQLEIVDWWVIGTDLQVQKGCCLDLL